MIGSSITPVASVQNEGSEGGVELTFHRSHEENFFVTPNEPNPWNRETSIGLRLPQDGTVSISIYDVDGKVHYIEHLNLLKGYQVYRITRDIIGKPGVYYYQLDYKDQSHTGKMVVMD